MEQIINCKPDLSSSKRKSYFPEKNTQSAMNYVYNNNKENGISALTEELGALFVSPSPSKFIEKKRTYLGSSENRKNTMLGELDSVKKKLHFEGYPNNHSEALATLNSHKKKPDSLIKGSLKDTKTNILKMR